MHNTWIAQYWVLLHRDGTVRAYLFQLSSGAGGLQSDEVEEEMGWLYGIKEVYAINLRQDEETAVF